MKSKEDVDVRSDRAGGRGLRSEVRNGLPSDGILLVVQGNDNLGSVLESIDGGIRRDERVSGEEKKCQKGTELESTAMAGALGVPTRPQAEVESQDNQVGDVSFFNIGGGGRRGHNGVENAKWDGPF